MLSALIWGWLFFWQTNWLHIIQPLLMMLACLGAFRGVGAQRFFRTPWIAVIGGMCYSMYLWHFFMIALVFKASRRLITSQEFLVNLVIQCAAILPCILLTTVLYFIFVERPCMDPQWPQKVKAALRLRTRRPVVR